MKKTILFLVAGILCGSIYVTGIFTKEDTTTYAQTDTKETIVIDAGHGGYDTGAIALDNTYEKYITLDIALQVGEILEKNNYNVIYTRESDDVSWPDDNLEDLQARCDIAKEYDANYFISIHTNSCDDEAQGFETYVNFNDEEMTDIAQSIHDFLSDLNYSTNRGLYDSNENELYILKNNTVPSLLLEIGFVTDHSDLNYMENHSDKLAEAIANGIIKQLEND